MEMGYTLADLANLKAALVSGARSVSIGDRTVTYNSVEDIITVIKMIQAELDPQDTTVESNPSIVRATFSRGGR